MVSSTSRYVITFNGEIYNHLSLRAKLEARGVSFRGHSDTEVLLALIEEEGLRSALAQAVGMFAIGLWDRVNRCLSLARDRFGEKPLAWSEQRGVLAFASELHAMRRVPALSLTIDDHAVADLLQWHAVTGERSIYREVRKVPPGTIVEFSENDGRILHRSVPYFSIDSDEEPELRLLSETQLVDELSARLSRSVREQLEADVPVGAFLSGGVDSSLIVALMRRVSNAPVRSFTVGFGEGRFDERPFARAVAEHLGTIHTEIDLAPELALTVIERLPKIFDEPFADSSQLPTVLVSRAIREHVVVALSGDGADELFGGYAQYRIRDRLAETADRIPGILRPLASKSAALVPRSLLRRAIRSSEYELNSLARMQQLLHSATPAVRYRTLMANWVSTSAVLRRRLEGREGDIGSAWLEHPVYGRACMQNDLSRYLPDDILVKVDRAAMSVSLETRAPFLDHRVAAVARFMPDALTIGGNGKEVLKRLLRQHLPAVLIDRPKMGFAIPLDEWLRAELRPWAEGLLHSSISQDWFSSGIVLDLWRRQLAGERHATRIWPILQFVQWADYNRTAT
jgi:asparagine synthase (glutamine-hydrolysing)